MEKPVGQEESTANNREIKKFAKDKSTEIDVVSEIGNHKMNIQKRLGAAAGGLTCYEYSDRRIGPASLFSHLDLQ